MTRTKRKLEALVKERNLREIPLSDLQELLPTCKESRSLHEALQQRYDDLRDATPGLSEADRAEERDKDEDILMNYDDLTRNLSKWVQRV